MTMVTKIKIAIGIVIAIIIILFLSTIRCWLATPDKIDNTNKDNIDAINVIIKENNDKMDVIDEEIDNSTTNDINGLLNKRKRK